MEERAGFTEQKAFTFAQPPNLLKLENSQRLGPVTIAYETYGRLNPDKSNAIMVPHALSGDSHVAGYYPGQNPRRDKPGWWNDMVGPGKALDTDHYFIICSNVLGGCRGSTGPSSPAPGTEKPYGLRFPIVTIADMVRCQKALLEHLGIEKLFAVIGGSMGGMQALQWVASYPEMVRLAIPIATTLRHSAQQIAFDEVGRQAVMADPDWNNGDYYGKGKPERGLAVARMVGHITYMSESSMEQKFGRRLKNKEKYGYAFTEEFEVEGYLAHQGDSFVKRFDANSYLYITKAMDYFDLPADMGAKLFQNTQARFLVLSFSSDWLYPPANSEEIVRLLKQRGIPVTYCELSSRYGHDAFLVEYEEQTPIIRNFLEAERKIMNTEPRV